MTKTTERLYQSYRAAADYATHAEAAANYAAHAEEEAYKLWQDQLRKEKK